MGTPDSCHEVGWASQVFGDKCVLEQFYAMSHPGSKCWKRMTALPWHIWRLARGGDLR